MKHCFCCAQSATSETVLICCEKLALSPLTHWDWHRDNWFVLEFIIRIFLPRCPNILKPGVRAGRLNSFGRASTRAKWKELNEGEQKTNWEDKRKKEDKTGYKSVLGRPKIKAGKNGSGTLETPFGVKLPWSKDSTQTQKVCARQSSLDKVLI